MNYEELRIHELTREYYGKLGITVYGNLIKYIKLYGIIMKQIFYIVPEDDGTQDSKVAASNFHVILLAIKQY